MIFLTQYNGAIVGPIARVLGYVISGLYNMFAAVGIENAALCIILFTILARTLMIPLNLRQQKATKLSSRMNPELMKIQDKYKGKKDEASQRKMQAETAAVYEKYGANPLSGCLPLLITFPIMIALYRVIYNIPAYIPAIYKLYEEVATAIQGVDGYVETLSGILSNATTLKVDEAGVPTLNAVIDVLATFSPDKWTELGTVFPDIVAVIEENSSRIMHINDLFGILNITEVPSLTSVSVLVPVVAAALQWYQGRQLSAGQPQNPNNQAANMTKSMNTFMPIMSGVFCLMLPIGVGLYWIAGSLFAIVQQFFVNRYFDKIDVDELIKANQMKALKKREKRGEDITAAKREMERAALKEAHEKEYEKKQEENQKNQSPAKKKEYKVVDYKKSEVSYSAGSIAANANILKNRDNKGDKKDE